MNILENKNVYFGKDTFFELIENKFIFFNVHADLLLNLFISEQIITKDELSGNKYKFRHIQFLEYLSAFYVVNYIYKKESIENLDELTRIIYDSEVVLLIKSFEHINYSYCSPC
jgi:hypothetical protein